MKRISTAALLMFFLLYFSAVKAETYKQIRIPYSDTSRIVQLLASGIEPIYAKDGEYIDYAVTPSEQKVFNDLGIAYTVVHDDMTAFYASRNPISTLMGGYYTLPEMVAIMDSFHTNYPTLCSQKSSVATTENGRAVWVFKISDNVDQNEAEPEIFIPALIHAREPLGGQVTVDFARWLLANYGSDTLATRIVNNYQIYFMPCINPDGYEYNRQTDPGGGGMWRCNRRNNGNGTYGVDENRNWKYQWGYDDVGSDPNPGGETYRGPSAASEPEISGTQNFINAHDFALIVNYHAYGNHFQYPWGFFHGYCPEPDQSYYLDTLAVYSRNQGFEIGTAWELLYDVNGESVDEDYGDDRLRRPALGLLFEIGTDNDGFWPSQSRIPTLVAQNLNILKDLIPRAYDVLKRRNPPQPTITGPSISPAGAPFYLHWTPAATDTFNAANSFKVIEGSGFSRTIQGFETTSDYTLDGFTRDSSNRYAGNFSAYSGHGSAQRKFITLNDRLKVQVGDNVTFWTRYNMTADYDYAYVQISTNGGVTWTNLDGNLSTTFNPHNHNNGHGITGTTNSNWVQATYWLYNYVGREVKIRIAYWGANGGGEGIYVDELSPDPVYSTANVLGETVFGDSLLIGPYAAGTKWFQVYTRDDRGQLSPSSDRFQIDFTGNVYNLSGHIALSDSPADLSGSVIGIGSLGMSDSTDTAGNYSMSGIPQGSYNIVISHFGYYSDTIYTFNIARDTTLNATLNPAPPAQPLLSLPANNSILDTQYVAFDWNDVAGANNYIIEIAADSNFSNIVMFDSTLVQSNYHNAEPFANASYYWRVTARNQVGYSSRSARWKFSISVTLSAPNLVAPANNFLSNNSTVNFDWDDVTGATLYVIEVAHDSVFADVVISDSALTQSLYSHTLGDGRYFWRVTAFNGTIYSSHSDTRVFTVITSLSQPLLGAPADGFESSVDHLDFDWNDVPNAINYIFEVASDSNFVNHIFNDSTIINPPHPQVGPFADGNYYWRVTAAAGQVYSPRSLVRRFAVLSIFIPGDANNNGTLNGLDVIFLVNYLRGTGPAPHPLLAADANGNCAVNGIDAVYLVNYFKGFGPDPIRGDCIMEAKGRQNPVEH